jgi:hypothetical protein
MLYSCTLSNLFFKSCENWAFLQQHKCPKQNILPQGLRTYRESVYLWEELGVIKPIGLKGCKLPPEHSTLNKGKTVQLMNM